MSRFARWVNSPTVAGWTLTSVALACLAGTWISWDAATSLRDHGVRATAVVTEVHGGRSSHVVLEFRDAAGHGVVADVGNYFWDPEPEVGDRAEILYDPEDPEGNVADLRMGPDFTAPWFFGVGAAVAAGLVWPTFTGRIDWDTLRS
ncbi:DUF3592 domain-containing protein [Knoellia locipacati]|uniref:DUF3592 domain-containing protein n=1 Tax=Knoellia locipacati TaxID=882824 RepID=UPI0038509711